MRDFTISVPSGFFTMRGSFVRERIASASSAGLQWACMSIMALSLSGNWTPREWGFRLAPFPISHSPFPRLNRLALELEPGGLDQLREAVGFGAHVGGERGRGRVLRLLSDLRDLLGAGGVGEHLRDLRIEPAHD